VVILDIQADGSLRQAEPKILLSHTGDNVRVIPETGAVLVAGPASGWAFLTAWRNNFVYTPAGIKQEKVRRKGKAQETQAGGLPSAVSIIANATKQFYGGKYTSNVILQDAEGRKLYGASVAAPYLPQKVMLVGGPMMHGVYQCELSSVVGENTKSSPQFRNKN
jgi:hypothetical protein